MDPVKTALNRIDQTYQLLSHKKQKESGVSTAEAIVPARQPLNAGSFESLFPGPFFTMAVLASLFLLFMVLIRASSPPTMLSFMSLHDAITEGQISIFPDTIDMEDSIAHRMARRQHYNAMNSSTRPAPSSDDIDMKTVIYHASELMASGLVALVHHGYRWVTDADLADIEALFHACHLNNVTDVNALLARGVSPNSWSSSEITPLMMAARDGFVNVLEALLAAGADPLIRTKNSNDALSYAAKSGCVEVFLELARQPGVDANSPGADRRTPLQHAAYAGRIELVSVLLSRPQVNIDHQDISGSTALHLAASEGHIKITEALLAAGASHRLVNNVGETALHRAAFRNQFHPTRLLLLAAADPLVRNNAGKLPMHMLHRRLFPNNATTDLLMFFTNMRLVLMPRSLFQDGLFKDIQTLIFSYCLALANGMSAF